MKTTRKQPVDTEKTSRHRLFHRDDDDLQWFAHHMGDMVQRAASYEVFGTSSPSSDPPWYIDFNQNTASARCRRIAHILWRARQVYQGADDILLAWAHPSAIECDGTDSGADQSRKKAGPGRILGVYPLTPLAASMRALAATGEPVNEEPARTVYRAFTLHGRNPNEMLRWLWEMKRKSAGEERNFWNRIHAQADDMLQSAIVAYQVAKADADPVVRSLPIDCALVARPSDRVHAGPLYDDEQTYRGVRSQRSERIKRVVGLDMLTGEDPKEYEHRLRRKWGNKLGHGSIPALGRIATEELIMRRQIGDDLYEAHSREIHDLAKLTVLRDRKIRGKFFWSEYEASDDSE